MGLLAGRAPPGAHPALHPNPHTSPPLSPSAPYSKPSVHLEPSKDLKPGDVAVVTCHASRGYPQASVLWQDSRGANLTSNVTTSQVANEEGLFEVHSVLHVLVEPSVTYSCLVLNTVLQQHGHASVTITGECPERGLWGQCHPKPLRRGGGGGHGGTGTQSQPGGLGEVAMVALPPKPPWGFCPISLLPHGPPGVSCCHLTPVPVPQGRADVFASCGRLWAAPNCKISILFFRNPSTPSAFATFPLLSLPSQSSSEPAINARGIN